MFKKVIVNKRIILLGVFIALFFIQCSTTSQPELEFERILCEYAENPIGIDKKSPRFSWIINTAARGKFQTAYQILVSSDPEILHDHSGNFWDSGIIESDETLHIDYKGKPLESNTTYYWKVTVWDEKDNMYESDINYFVTAFLSQKDWKAKWIGANPAFEPKPEKGFYMDKNEESQLEDSVHHSGWSILLRREFEINKTVASARLFITGLGFYESEINGNKVGEYVLAPAKTPYHKHILYDTYDVTNKIRRGSNAIGIHLGNGWYNPYKKWWKEYRMQWFGYKKALAQLHIEFQDGSEQIIVTDENWKISEGPVLFNCVYDGEVYDANEEIAGWSEPWLDDTEWDGAVIMDAPKATILSQIMPAIEVNEIKKPVKISEPKKGMKVYDLGQNFTGWIKLKMKGEKGTKVSIRFSEELYEDGTLNFTCNEHAKATIEYIMNGNEFEDYEPAFTYFGFQFVEITSEGPMPEILDLEGCVVYSANKTIGKFSSSHELINKMHHATVWSQKSNMLSYPMDCPQRDERLGWMGDAQVTAEEAMFNFDMALHYINWFRGIRANQDESSGDIPIISPRPYIKDEGIEWSSSYLTILWNSYQYYGDKQVLVDNYSSMARYMEFLDDVSEDYIAPKGWIGDWGSMVKGWKEGEPESVPTAFYYYNATIMRKVAKVLGKTDDATKYADLAKEIKHAYNKNFFDTISNNYNDGSQMANAFPLYLGIVEKGKRQAVLDNLIGDIVDKNDTHLTTGVLGTKYLIDALSLHGRSDISWALATQISYPSWAEMMKRFNTMCEFWTLKQSHNHVMMGSIDAWFYKTLGGIQLDENYPAFKHFVIKPYLADGFDHVKTSTQTLRGEIVSEWERYDNHFEHKVKVPFNSTAEVYIHVEYEKAIFEGGINIKEKGEIELQKTEEGYQILKVPSGEWNFSYSE